MWVEHTRELITPVGVSRRAHRTQFTADAATQSPGDFKGMADKTTIEASENTNTNVGPDGRV